MNWDCLLVVLAKCGFVEKWRQWIIHCISTVRFCILVNQFLKDFFSSSKGLRQGDLFSPLLFFLILEVLSKMLQREVGGEL